MDVVFAFEPLAHYELDLSALHEIAARHRHIGSADSWHWVLPLGSAAPKILETTFNLAPSPKLFVHTLVDLPESYREVVAPLDLAITSTLFGSRHAVGDDRRKTHQAVRIASDLTSLFRAALKDCTASLESLDAVFSVAVDAILGAASRSRSLSDDEYEALLHGSATKIRSMLALANGCGHRRAA